jgi:hypothetical protein
MEPGPGAVTVTVRASGGHGDAGASAVAAAIEWAVVERVVELHGGTVEASDGPERWARLRLPVRS